MSRARERYFASQFVEAGTQLNHSGKRIETFGRLHLLPPRTTVGKLRNSVAEVICVFGRVLQQEGVKEARRGGKILQKHEMEQTVGSSS